MKEHHFIIHCFNSGQECRCTISSVMSENQILSLLSLLWLSSKLHLRFEDICLWDLGKSISCRSRDVMEFAVSQLFFRKANKKTQTKQCLYTNSSDIGRIWWDVRWEMREHNVGNVLYSFTFSLLYYHFVLVKLILFILVLIL